MRLTKQQRGALAGALAFDLAGGLDAEAYGVLLRIASGARPTNGDALVLRAAWQRAGCPPAELIQLSVDDEVLAILTRLGDGPPS
jgi:hypothetical protein